MSLVVVVATIFSPWWLRSLSLSVALTHSLHCTALIQHNHIDFRVHTATCCSERDGKTTDTFLIRGVCDAQKQLKAIGSYSAGWIKYFSFQLPRRILEAEPVRALLQSLVQWLLPAMWLDGKLWQWTATDWPGLAGTRGAIVLPVRVKQKYFNKGIFLSRKYFHWPGDHNSMIHFIRLEKEFDIVKSWNVTRSKWFDMQCYAEQKLE